MKKILLILMALLLVVSVYAQEAVRMPIPIDGAGLGQN